MAIISTRDEEHYQRQHELLTRHFRNGRRRDLVLLVLSGAVLIISVALVSLDFVARSSVAVPLLVVAWGLLALAILSVLISFQIGQASTYLHLRDAQTFFVRDQVTAARGARIAAMLNDACGWFSSLVFVAATICLVVFISINVASVGGDETEPPASFGNASHASALLPVGE